MDITIAMAAYKEGDNLKILLPKIHDVMKATGLDYEILAVDGLKASDDSPEICQKFGAKYISGGDTYGDAIRCCVNSCNGRQLLIMDADGSHNPEYIPKFIQKQKETGCDLVIGSRYVDGGDSNNGIILKILSHILNFTYRTIFNIYAKDISGSFRLYKAEQIKSLKLECVNFDVLEEILIQLAYKYKNFKTVEIPISFNQRMFGESKRNLFSFAITYMQSIARLYNIKLKIERNK
jgi:dolichol-phosphate mannosyltransferase